ncbi:hypothetical protein GCM10010446_25130 [Streptomyces enissocaesilis]|uniref:Uncharacterized protein n=1 Tax=Streptomyces enissocaesilis TaxID=332589 RepID=A0ABN3X8J4_9ACTN
MHSLSLPLDLIIGPEPAGRFVGALVRDLITSDLLPEPDACSRAPSLRGSLPAGGRAVLAYGFDEVVAGVRVNGDAVSFAGEAWEGPVEGFPSAEVAQGGSVGCAQGFSGHQDGDARRCDGDHRGGDPPAVA